MSKGEGLKIGIKFTEEILGNLSEKNLYGYKRPEGTFTSSGAVTGYPVGNAFDGIPASYWYNSSGGSSQWVQIMFPDATVIAGFRWKNKSGFRPKDFKLQGSANGSTWVDVFTSTSANADGWQSFIFPNVSYKYYRWTILNYHNSQIQMSELQIRVPSGNEGAFTITGKQYKHVNGELMDVEFMPISIEKHPVEEKSLLLTFDWWGRFNNAEGKIRVEYDATKGNLSGSGGAVESFSVEFSPLDLTQTPNPGIDEYISIAPIYVIGDLKDITIAKAKADDHTITVAPVQVSGVMLNIEEINP